MGAEETNTLFRDLSQLQERDHLETSTVGQDVVWP